MTKTIDLFCIGTPQNKCGVIRTFEYIGDQQWIKGEKLYELYNCPVCHRTIGMNYTEFYLNLTTSGNKK